MASPQAGIVSGLHTPVPSHLAYFLSPEEHEKVTTVPTALLEPSQFETEKAGAAGGSEEQEMAQTTFKVGSFITSLDVWL